MYYDGKVHIEDEDQCISCQHFVQGVTCPLLEALAVGVAHLEGDILVKNCGFYVEFKRHLRVVESTQPVEAVGEENPDDPPTETAKDKSKRFN